MSEYKTGQTFWWVSNNNARTQSEVTVEKVGRVWLTLSNGQRVDKLTLKADGGSWASPGTCWPSKAEYDETVRLRTAWMSLRKQLNDSWEAPNNVTVEDIKAAAVYLKLEIKA
jgi:hypothetical protein